jgi:chromate reductase
MKIVAICGSLRAGSANAAILRACVALAPPELEIALYEGLGELPHYNPDLDVDGDQLPAAVATLRALCAAAAGFVISSPEYAHNLPGVLKNGLDWLVSSGELGGKPIMLVNAAPTGGQRAQASLMQTLAVMSAEVLVEASLTAPFVRQRLAPSGQVDDETATALRRSLRALADALSRLPPPA